MRFSDSTYWHSSLLAFKLHNSTPSPRDTTTQTAKETNEYLTEPKQELEDSDEQETQKYGEVENPVSVFFRVRAGNAPVIDYVTGSGVFSSRRNTRFFEEPLEIEGFRLEVTGGKGEGLNAFEQKDPVW